MIMHHPKREVSGNAGLALTYRTQLRSSCNEADADTSDDDDGYEYCMVTSHVLSLSSRRTLAEQQERPGGSDA
jgi:hypothetical protein